MQTFAYIFFDNDILRIMVTDYIMIVALLFFLIRGWRKGVLKTLLAPMALIIGWLTAFLYYQKTQNIAVSLAIGVFSPFILRILAALILKLWDKAANQDVPLSISSHVLGSVFGVLWSGSYLAMVLILIGMVPLHEAWFEKIQNDVHASKSYDIFHQFMDKKMPSLSGDINKITAIAEDPAKLQKFQSTKEFESLLEDDTLKEIFSDKELTEQIQNKEYGKLLTNPKIQAIMKDGQLLEKMFAMNKKIMEEHLNDDLIPLQTESESKVIYAP